MTQNRQEENSSLTKVRYSLTLMAYAALVFMSSYALSASNVQIYRNDQLGFEVTYPTRWEVNKLSKGPVFALKNKDNSKLGVFSISVANLGFDEQQLWDTVVADRGNSTVEQMKTRFGEAVLRSSGVTNLSGHRAYRTEIRYVLKNLDIVIPIINVQVMCIHNRRVYLINFESPEFSYEENKSVFQSVVYSFNFRK